MGHTCAYRVPVLLLHDQHHSHCHAYIGWFCCRECFDRHESECSKLLDSTWSHSLYLAWRPQSHFPGQLSPFCNRYVPPMLPFFPPCSHVAWLSFHLLHTLIGFFCTFFTCCIYRNFAPSIIIYCCWFSNKTKFVPY